MSEIYSVLHKYFGYNSFRPLQEEIITRILGKKDTFVLMPTGGGKSLCYQVPSLVLPGTTIVISPLISLMKDQVDVLRQNGISAAYLNSSLSQTEQTEVLDQLVENKLSLLYVAPERLVQDSFLSVLKTIDINFFAIDEAHCISQWGHDFRPEYRQLNMLKKLFPEIAIVALTATATERVKEDIISRLNLSDLKIFQASFNRPNLSYAVIAKNNPTEQLHDYVLKHPGESGIIYCLSRSTVEKVAKQLQDRGIKALPYHAGLSDEQRSENQEKFIREDVDIIAATIAFGMGIDKPNVRFVIHYNLPKTLEHYYQETGRAGRDGLPSECILLFSFGDRSSLEHFIREKSDEKEQLIAIQQLNRMIDFAQSTVCRRYQLLEYFGEISKKSNCGSCDNCTIVRETFNATIVTQKILSCIYHLRGKFGIAQVTNILTGSKAQKIIDYNHHKLSTYGIIEDYSRDDIKKFIYELTYQGYIKQSQDQYGLLGLTEKSIPVLQNKEQVYLNKPPKTVKVSRSKREKYERADSIKYIKNQELFEILRKLRKRLADEANVPPFVVFSDSSLIDMTQKLPRNKHDFGLIRGVGDKKLEMYANIFLAEIIRYISKTKNQ